MRLFILVLFSSCLKSASGQSFLYENDSAYIRMIDLPAAEPFDTAHAYKRVKEPYLYIISPKDVYELFGYDLSNKLRGFNFADHHILGQRVCHYCFLHCKHKRSGTGPCHRNSCSYVWKWTVRDNQKAFSRIPTITFKGHLGDSLPKYLPRDTTIVTSKDTTRWYTSGGGDCFAKHVYELYSDRYYPNIILKEYNHYGGCRAGGRFKYTIQFNMPVGTWIRVKRTILVDRYN